MDTHQNRWTKTELQIYILLLCANVDAVETPKELQLIRSNVDEKSFERIYNEFSNDTKEESLKKIQDAVSQHEYSEKEMIQLKKEIHKIFLSDKKFMVMERNLEKLLDNIIY